MSQKQQSTLRNRNNPLVQFSIWGITEVYRKNIKPFKAERDYKKGRITLCSFYPSCSEYGILALKKDGFFKGWYKTVGRVSKCTTYRHKESCVEYP